MASAKYIFSVVCGPTLQDVVHGPRNLPNIKTHPQPFSAPALEGCVWVGEPCPRTDVHSCACACGGSCALSKLNTLGMHLSSGYKSPSCHHHHLHHYKPLTQKEKKKKEKKKKKTPAAVH
ncbi:hypothetical protein EYF80_003589 [Liparis tanakae]|uniref:Uncharacterized protein n=1 Tax=Liparis tanakae TaxID=230148 RepID=A0A4Z2J9S9_9TELE|nr:hypothetical protein EYF80_003589 [Liparis tanakae]